MKKLVAAVILIILIAFTVLRFFAKQPPSNIDPIKQFQQFDRLVGRSSSQRGDNVGSLISGMSLKEAIQALKTMEIAYGRLTGNLEFDALVQEYRFENTLRTGDILKSVVVAQPLDLPEEIAYVALSFFNDELFQVTYIYKGHEITQAIPKEPKFAHYGAIMTAKQSQDKWNTLANRTVLAAHQKYENINLSYPNFFCNSEDPQQISNSGGSVLFYGASKSAVVQITYHSQNTSNIGAYDPYYAVVINYETRVIVAEFYFLDEARKCALAFYDRKRNIAKNDKARKAQEHLVDLANERAVKAKATEEEQKKTDKLQKSF